jgi:hypothetical protein
LGAPPPLNDDAAGTAAEGVALAAAEPGAHPLLLPLARPAMTQGVVSDRMSIALPAG